MEQGCLYSFFREGCLYVVLDDIPSCCICISKTIYVTPRCIWHAFPCSIRRGNPSLSVGCHVFDVVDHYGGGNRCAITIAAASRRMECFCYFYVRFASSGTDFTNDNAALRFLVLLCVPKCHRMHLSSRGLIP